MYVCGMYVCNGFKVEVYMQVLYCICTPLPHAHSAAMTMAN